MTDRRTVFTVVVALAVLAVVGLVGLILLVDSHTPAADLAVISGPVGVVIGGLTGLLISTRSGPEPAIVPVLNSALGSLPVAGGSLTPAPAAPVPTGAPPPPPGGAFVVEPPTGPAPATGVGTPLPASGDGVPEQPGQPLSP